MVSPLHRDPESGSEDYGCFTDESNRKVAAAVRQTITLIKAGEFSCSDEVVDFVRSRLLQIPDGATDTVVKENVFLALAQEMKVAGLNQMDLMKIYGW